MKVYKFKDLIDGRYAFVLAASEKEASERLESLTSIPFEIVDSRWVEKMRPTIIRNDILPF